MSIQSERLKTYLLGILLLTTVAAVFIQSALLNRILVINALSPFNYHAQDDRDDGGASISSVEVIDSKLVLHCTIIKNDLEWRYCSLSFNLVENDTNQGMDLTDYSYVKAWVKYEVQRRDGIRFELRNFDSSYSVAGDVNSLNIMVLSIMKKIHHTLL